MINNVFLTAYDSEGIAIIDVLNAIRAMKIERVFNRCCLAKRRSRCYPSVRLDLCKVRRVLYSADKGDGSFVLTKSLHIENYD